MHKIFNRFKSLNNKALSLVEVLLAIVILALVATPILQVYYSSLSMNQQSRKMLDAADLTDATLEFVSSKVFEEYQYTHNSSTIVVPGLKDFYWGPDMNPFNNQAKQNTLKLYGISNSTLFPDGPKCNYSNLFWYPETATAGAGDVKGMQLCCGNVKYNNSDYCVRIIIEGDPSTSDAYYSYKVTVEVYDGHYNAAGVQHQQDTLAAAEHPELVNVNESFNYGTINDGYYDKLCSGFTYIQNKY